MNEKNKISVLMGDFILSKALINMIGIKDFDKIDQNFMKILVKF